MRIIPAIDLYNGKAVRLLQGDFNAVTQYSMDPLETALKMQEEGAEYLHLVDLNGALSGQPEHLNILEEICKVSRLKVDYSGGIKSEIDFQKAFDLGADKICIGSMAVKNKDLFLKMLQKFGKEKISVSADYKQDLVAIKGWTEQTNIQVKDFIQEYMQLGVAEFIVTDISKDGTLKGPATDMYRQLIQDYGATIIASGGISNLEDLQLLKLAGCQGAIIGKAYYENKISIKEAMSC